MARYKRADRRTAALFRHPRAAEAAASQEVSPDIITQTGAVFSPTFTLGNVDVTPAIITQTGAVFAFTRIDQEVTVAIITQTGATFTPQVDLAVASGLIDQTGAVFAPTFTLGNVDVTPAIITQTGATFDPTFTLQARAYISWVELQVPGTQTDVGLDLIFMPWYADDFA